jgi:hypothetical protein
MCTRAGRAGARPLITAATTSGADTWLGLVVGVILLVFGVHMLFGHAQRPAAHAPSQPSIYPSRTPDQRRLGLVTASYRHPELAESAVGSAPGLAVTVSAWEASASEVSA